MFDGPEPTPENDVPMPSAKWSELPFRKLFGLVFVLVFGAVMLKAVIYAVVAVTFDIQVMPLRWVAVFGVLVSIVAAYLITRWVKNLVDAEEARRQW